MLGSNLLLLLLVATNAMVMKMFEFVLVRNGGRRFGTLQFHQVLLTNTHGNRTAAIAIIAAGIRSANAAAVTNIASIALGTSEQRHFRGSRLADNVVDFSQFVAAAHFFEFDLHGFGADGRRSVRVVVLLLLLLLLRRGGLLAHGVAHGYHVAAIGVSHTATAIVVHVHAVHINRIVVGRKALCDSCRHDQTCCYKC